ncbi:NUDIX domain-containing protein [Aeromicrobium sp.]|uniref:NUDIX domain-containing protein n=1 Tax=Aeromicrobium sp. TaxID=1871063 RepID=UPI0035164AB3
MTTDKDQQASALGYRPCVGVMLVNYSGEVFVGRRIDTKEGDFWQMPQGGIDPGEDPRDALFRELWEETGVVSDKVAVIGQTAEPLRYDLPDDLIGKLWGGPQVGPAPGSGADASRVIRRGRRPARGGGRSRGHPPRGRGRRAARSSSSAPAR